VIFPRKPENFGRRSPGHGISARELDLEDLIVLSGATGRLLSAGGPFFAETDFCWGRFLKQGDKMASRIAPKRAGFRRSISRQGRGRKGPKIEISRGPIFKSNHEFQAPTKKGFHRVCAGKALGARLIPFASPPR